MKSKKKLRRKKTSLRKGAAGSGMMLIMTLVLIAGVAFALIGGQFPQLDDKKVGESVVIIPPGPDEAKNTLQLITLRGATVTPTPATSQGAGWSCEAPVSMTRGEEMLWGSDPAPGTKASSGKIRLWLSDEFSPQVCSNEVVDRYGIPSGGDRYELDGGYESLGMGKYFWEPTLYLKPATSNTIPAEPWCDALTPGCTPHFVDIIKGWYNNNHKSWNSPLKGPEVDSDKADFENGPRKEIDNCYKEPFISGGCRISTLPGNHEFIETEYIWDLTTFGLTPGNYWAQFVVHDGDIDVLTGCIAIQI